ncbi:hypothetical protein PHISCL_07490 [Aspergillus sclerotialis]|uniref:Uncharacterized protein n=1 Tax=Aspergillus sclerotialis TaxID=2070753 RepID=A0A3A2ZD08_9EURO|nr:hypothetical protein PHISCL_07490 [Aspergillus sclerotialis]
MYCTYEPAPGRAVPLGQSASQLKLRKPPTILKPKKIKLKDQQNDLPLISLTTVATADLNATEEDISQQAQPSASQHDERT